METLKNYTFKAKDTLKKGLVNAGLAGILMFGASSCGKTTPEDVIVEKKNIEIMNGQIRSYINSRKDFVGKYNNLCIQSQSESNTYQIEMMKANYLDIVLSIEKKIDDLVDKMMKAEKRVGEKSAECVFVTNSGLLDPDKYDFLLND